VDFIGRSDGPISFRLILQPAVAIILAIRAGMRDARYGRPPFLWAVWWNQDRRQELIRQGWEDVGKVFIVALVLDSIYQVIVHSSIYALELLLTATLLRVLLGRDHPESTLAIHTGDRLESFSRFFLLLVAALVLIIPSTVH
jgi:hypothetical protein